jgi:hypothetical protein
MSDHGIPHKRQSNHHSIQYLTGRMTLVHIFLQSDGNVQLTGAIGANTVYRIKANCIKLGTKEIMVILTFFSFGYSIFEGRSGTYSYFLIVSKELESLLFSGGETCFRN